MNKIYHFLSKGKWYRKVSKAKTICLGGQVYYLAEAVPKEELQITFDPTLKMFIFQNDKELIVKAMSPKRLSKYDLMGGSPPIFQLPDFQLELPFDWCTQKKGSVLK